jgi:hypothetical protein
MNYNAEIEKTISADDNSPVTTSFKLTANVAQAGA